MSTRRIESFSRLIPLSFMIVLLLLVGWLGARGLNVDSLWYDEIWSLYYAGGSHYGPLPLDGTVARVIEQIQHEKNPPGYYLVLNLWGRAVGWTDFAGRCLSLLVGLLAVAWTYRLGRDLRPATSSGVLIGLGTAVAIGGSAFFIYYLHELRAYSTTVLMTALLVWIYWRLLHHTHRVRWSLGLSFILSIGASLYLHYLMAVVVWLLGLYHLLFAPKNQRWWPISLLALVGMALFLPWLPQLLSAATRTEGVHPYSLDMLDTISTLGIVFSNASVALLLALALMVIQARGRHVGLVAFLAVGGTSLAVLINAVFPIVTHIRYLLILWPLLALLVGLAVDHLAQRGVSPAWILGVWLLAGLWNVWHPGFAPTLDDVPSSWREFNAELRTHAQPGDQVMFHFPRYFWLREFELDHYTYALPVTSHILEKIPGQPSDGSYAAGVRQTLEDISRVWLGVDRLVPSDFRLQTLQAVLADDFAFCYQAFDRADMSLDLYARAPASPKAMPYRFGDGIRLELLEPLQPIQSKKLSLLLGWSVSSNVPPNTYSIALHVEDETGQLVGQGDYNLPAEAFACRPSQVSLSPGNYTLLVGVYNSQTGERLPAWIEGAAESHDRLVLGTFTVQ